MTATASITAFATISMPFGIPRMATAKVSLAKESGGKLSVCAVLDPIPGAENLPVKETQIKLLH